MSFFTVSILLSALHVFLIFGGFLSAFPPKVFVLHQLQPVSKLRPKWTQVKMRSLPQTSLTEILGTWSRWPWLGRSVAGRQRGQSVNSGTGESGSHCQKWRLQKKKNKINPRNPHTKCVFWVAESVITLLFPNQQVSSVFREQWTSSMWKSAYVVKIFPSVFKATVMLLKQQLFNSGFSYSCAYHASLFYLRHRNSLSEVVLCLWVLIWFF